MKLLGRLDKLLYHSSDTGFVMALFKVKETKKFEVVSGKLFDLNFNVDIILEGEYYFNQKYKKNQFEFTSYEIIKPSDTDSIYEFLKSDFIKGCGAKTAKKIVDFYKEESLEKLEVLENILALKIAPKTALNINEQVLAFKNSKVIIDDLISLGFTMEEASKVFFKYQGGTLDIVENHFYKLKEIILFQKLDMMYLAKNDPNTSERIYHLIIEVLKFYAFSDGHVFLFREELIDYLRLRYRVNPSSDEFEEVTKLLESDCEIIIVGTKYYLTEYYDAEILVSKKLKDVSQKDKIKLKHIDARIESLEESLNIKYDSLQKEAIVSALTNNFTIISGGPGTGKTTILNAIVSLYVIENMIGPAVVPAKIALLAPTGRASKKMSQSTGYPGYTIHKHLKWNRESDTFEYNEENHIPQDLIIIDEISMIDLKLFSSLMKALKKNVQIILVGDASQLPSVGAGLVLSDLIESDLFNFISLSKIYRQEEDSYIPFLSQNIKNGEVNESMLQKKEDYNFIKCSSDNIQMLVNQILIKAKEKEICADNIQILAPIYRGSAGIHSLNEVMRNLYNPKDFERREYKFNDAIFREGDKVIYLVNDSELGISNGDIGYILKIIKNEKMSFIVSFDDKNVTFERKHLNHLAHAYAITVHKSQGSEFENVIMPISEDYGNMLFNKLLYTGVSRAKKSLILVGDENVLSRAILNNKPSLRNSSLKDALMSIFID